MQALSRPGHLAIFSLALRRGWGPCRPRPSALGRVCVLRSQRGCRWAGRCVPRRSRSCRLAVSAWRGRG